MAGNSLLLVGQSLGHSFSKDFFAAKFNNIGAIDWHYDNFEIPIVEQINSLRLHKDLRGFNVTIPYKTTIIPFLDSLSPEAFIIGAVNTVVVSTVQNKHFWTGYNTDALAFKSTIVALNRSIANAMILGTGGAAKAVAYALEQMGVQVIKVGRKTTLSYHDITKNIMVDIQLIVNTTPLGMFPEVDKFPEIPYQWLNKEHILYDLIYNPSETLFLKKGKERSFLTINGLEMLQIQADLAWEMWRK